jgi:hypothetical protein
MQTAINLDYNVSSFLYRVCYPKWDGYGLEHDPTYVAYLNAMAIPEVGPPFMIVLVAVTLGSVALIVALRDLRKTRRMLSSREHNLPTSVL